MFGGLLSRLFKSPVVGTKPKKPTSWGGGVKIVFVPVEETELTKN
jgi:hypothetical protein